MLTAPDENPRGWGDGEAKLKNWICLTKPWSNLKAITSPFKYFFFNFHSHFFFHGCTDIVHAWKMCIWYLQTLLFSSYCDAESLPKATFQSEANTIHVIRNNR